MTRHVSLEASAVQPVVSHAERLAALLFACELTPPTGDATASTWLTGRAAEVERVVESVIDDWSSGAAKESDVVAMLGSYLAELHAGLRVHLHLDTPSCCDARPPERRMSRRARDA
jgi:hypothetical protein